MIFLLKQDCSLSVPPLSFVSLRLASPSRGLYVLVINMMKATTPFYGTAVTKAELIPDTPITMRLLSRGVSMHSRNASTSSERLGKSCAIPEKSLLENIGPATRTSTSAVRVSQLTCNFFTGRRPRYHGQPQFFGGRVKPVSRAKITGLYIYSAYRDINVRPLVQF